MIFQVLKKTTAVSSYKKVQLHYLRNNAIFAKSYFGQRLNENIVGEKGGYF
jgi:hypothetical protein